MMLMLHTLLLLRMLLNVRSVPPFHSHFYHHTTTYVMLQQTPALVLLWGFLHVNPTTSLLHLTFACSLLSSYPPHVDFANTPYAVEESFGHH